MAVFSRCPPFGTKRACRVAFRGAHWLRVSFYLLLLLIAAIGAAAYLLLFFSHVPGAHEERFGSLPQLPESFGKWIKDPEPNEEGLIRERRQLLEEASSGERIIRQVRYRHPDTKKIVRVLPEKIVRRRRVRGAA